MAKKQVCMMVLMRTPMPVSLRHGVGIDGVELELLVDDLLLHPARELIPHLVFAIRSVEQEDRASLAASSTL